MKGRLVGDINPATKLSSRIKQSNTKKRKILDGTYTGHHYKLNHIQSNITKQKISKKAIERLSDPTKNPMYGKTHAPETIQKIFSNRNITAPEIKIRDFLSNKNIDYTYQYFIIHDGICKSYDFKINNIPLLIEIDGDYWHGGPGVTKHFYKVNDSIKNDLFKNKLAESKGLKILRFWESEINNNFESICQNILNEIQLLIINKINN
jgi:hypothetical protein